LTVRPTVRHTATVAIQLNAFLMALTSSGGERPLPPKDLG